MKDAHNSALDRAIARSLERARIELVPLEQPSGEHLRACAASSARLRLRAALAVGSQTARFTRRRPRVVQASGRAPRDADRWPRRSSSARGTLDHLVHRARRARLSGPLEGPISEGRASSHELGPYVPCGHLSRRAHQDRSRRLRRPVPHRFGDGLQVFGSVLARDDVDQLVRPAWWARHSSSLSAAWLAGIPRSRRAPRGLGHAEALRSPRSRRALRSPRRGRNRDTEPMAPDDD